MVFDDNRREYHRMQTDCPVLFRSDGDEALQEGYCHNLSTGGIAFSCDQALDAGSHIDIFITPEVAIVPPLDASVEVLRVEESEGRFRVAGKITALR